MEQSFERIGEHFYKRSYSTAKGEQRLKFYALFTDWKGIRRRFPLGSDEKSAKQGLRILEADNVKRVDFDKEREQRRAEEKRLTFSQWATLYFAEMISPDKRSVEWEKFVVKKLELRFGRMFLDEIDEPAIDDYRDRRLRDPVTRGKKIMKGTRISLTTCNLELAVLRMLLRLAKRKKKIKTVPDFNIIEDKSRKRDRIASEEEYTAILANMKRYHQRPLIGLYETSMRLNELLKLTWPKIDEKAGFIRLKAEETKEKRPRSIPISPALRVVLNELREEQSRAKVVNIHQRVFTKPNGLPIRNIRDAWLKALAAAKIKNLRLHDFRHTCITRWEMEGKPVGKIMAASGHHSIEMHNRYVNTKEHHLKDFFGVNVLLTTKKDGDSGEAKEAVSS